MIIQVEKVKVAVKSLRVEDMVESWLYKNEWLWGRYLPLTSSSTLYQLDFVPFWNPN